ncbi:MAG: CvpA family protein [Azospirillaceae bacterium]|nr:CvpA family protein [Azospirillaceae bacterium]
MESYSINPADIAVIGVVLLSALVAFARGMVREVLSVAGWVGAAFATLHGQPLLRDYAHHFISSPMIANAAAGIVIFVVTLLVLSIISSQLARLVRGSALSAVDRSLGFVFGLLRGAFFVSLAYLLVSAVLPVTDQPAWLLQARTLPVIQQGAGLLRDLVPEETRAGALADVDAGAKAVEDQARQAASDAMLQRLSTPVPSSVAGAAAGAAPATATTAGKAPGPVPGATPGPGFGQATPTTKPKTPPGYADKDRVTLDQLFENTKRSTP